ncbi:MAG: hypothetical protein PUP90_24500 [Nostoc sp. S4]|nr:hypothetical protein [Nostoc sp. S4]
MFFDKVTAIAVASDVSFELFVVKQIGFSGTSCVYIRFTILP